MPPSSAAEPVRVLIAGPTVEGRGELERLVAEEGGLVVATEASASLSAGALDPSRAEVVVLEIAGDAELLRELGEAALVVVADTTEHAARAFDVGAVDYLVAPVGRERFARAFARARDRVMLERLKDQLFVLFRGQGVGADVQPAMAEPGEGPLERIAVEMRGKVRVVPVGEIDYVTSSGPYLELHAGERRHLIRASMRDLERRLDAARFVRIHRSVIVQLDRIETLLKGRGGEYEVMLRGGARLRVSRARREMLERRLGVIPTSDV